MLNLKEKAKSLPRKPGVYLMKDSMDNIIYIGKSKSLRDRVTSYFQKGSNLLPKIKEMIGYIDSFEIIFTDTEVEALLLESKLIKEKKPMYNSLLKNTKRYVYIKITTEEKYPRILHVYDKDDDDSMYFGPYTSLGSAERTIDLIKDHFPIIQCKNPYRSKKKVCLNYHLKRCPGVCEGIASYTEYKKNIKEIIKFLKGRRSKIIVELEEKMRKASADFDYINAARYRDQLSSAKTIINTGKIIYDSVKGKKTVAIELISEDKVKFFLIKGNILVDKKVISMENTNKNEIKAEVEKVLLDSFSKAEQNNKHDRNSSVIKKNIDEIMIIASYLRKEEERVKTINYHESMEGDKEALETFTDKLTDIGITLISELGGSD